MENSHWDKCRSDILHYADELVVAIKDGRMNESVFEGHVRSVLTRSPAFANVDQRKLLKLALERLGVFEGYP